MPEALGRPSKILNHRACSFAPAPSKLLNFLPASSSQPCFAHGGPHGEKPPHSWPGAAPSSLPWPALVTHRTVFANIRGTNTWCYKGMRRVGCLGLESPNHILDGFASNLQEPCAACICLCLYAASRDLADDHLTLAADHSCMWTWHVAVSWHPWSGARRGASNALCDAAGSATTATRS